MGRRIIGSHDIEDVVALIGGRAEIVREAHGAPRDVPEYLAAQHGDLLDSAAFLDALSGFLMPDGASQARQALLLERLPALTEPRA